MNESQTRSSHTLDRFDAGFYLGAGITAREVMRLQYPAVTDDQLDHLLWEHTPYPLVSGLDDLADLLPVVCDCDPGEEWIA